MQNLKIWVEELRAPFFVASAMPAVLGGVIAWYNSYFDLLFFILAVVGIVSINAGINLVNDYFDFINEIDTRTKRTPFSGGSRFIVEGSLKPKSVYLMGMVFFGLAILIGIYFWLKTDWVIVVIGGIGISTAYLYSTRIAKTGLGELTVGIDLGPLAVLGAYYVQTEQLAIAPIIVSIPVGLLVAAILYINEFPDCEADMSAGRYHLIARLGKRKAVNGYIGLLVATYLSIIFAIVFGYLTVVSIFALITIPLAWKSINLAKKHYDEIEKFVPAQAYTIQIHIITGIILCSSFIISKWLRIG